jgi:hypothetical protein
MEHYPLGKNKQAESLFIFLRKRNPLRLTYKDYLNNRDSYRISFDEWKQKNEWEDTDKCDRCGA